MSEETQAVHNALAAQSTAMVHMTQAYGRLLIAAEQRDAMLVQALANSQERVAKLEEEALNAKREMEALARKCGPCAQCVEIQLNDHTRHFKGCPRRVELVEGQETRKTRG